MVVSVKAFRETDGLDRRELAADLVIWDISLAFSGLI
jgi:hypothetical protein